MSTPAPGQPAAEVKIAFLRRVPLLRGFDERLLGLLAGIMDLRRVPAGSILCEEGGPGDACFVIGHGKVEVVTGHGADERKLCVLGPGHAVGEVALIDGKKRSATVRCLTDVSVFALRRLDFDQLLGAGNHASMQLLDNVAQALAQRVRVANERFADIFSHAGETMTALTRQLEELRGTLEQGGGGEVESSDDLLELVGYQAGPASGS